MWVRIQIIQSEPCSASFTDWETEAPRGQKVSNSCVILERNTRLEVRSLAPGSGSA